MNLISWDDLPEAARFSKPHLRKMEQQGKFPKRVRLSPFRIAWVEDEIQSWLAARAAERNSAPQAA
jgi:prophage regulatory protein